MGLGRLHDALGNHRNTSIIPASMLGAVAEAPTRFSGWRGGHWTQQPGNRAPSEGCLRSAWRNWPRCTGRIWAGLKPLAGTFPSKTCFGWRGRWASRLQTCLRPSASAPSGPVYDKKVYHSRSCRQALRTVVVQRCSTALGAICEAWAQLPAGRPFIPRPRHRSTSNGNRAGRDRPFLLPVVCTSLQIFD